MRNAKLPLWLAVATIGFSAAPTLVHAQQARNAFEQQQQQRERQSERQAERRAEREQKREDQRDRELLRNMPKEARQALEAQTKGAQGDIDYYKTEVNGERAFGAIFKEQTGQVVDVRVNRDGKVLSRLGAAQQAAAAAAAPATPQPVAPAPAPAPAPAAAAPAAGEFVQANANSTEAGSVNFRDLPAPVQDTIRRETAGGRDVFLYRTADGYLARMKTGPNDPRLGLAIRVDPTGRVIERQELGSLLAGAPAPAAQAQQPVPSPSGLPDPRQTNANSRDPFAVNFRDLPPAVQEAVRQETRGAQDVRLWRSQYGNQNVYLAEVHGTANDPRADSHVRIDPTGKIVDRKAVQDDAQTAAANQRRDPFTLTAGDIPAAARNTLDRELRGASDIRYYRARQGSQDVIEGKGELRNGNDIAVRVDNSGKVIDRREIKDENAAAASRDTSKLTLGDIPAAARRTIEQESRGKKDVRYYRAKQGSKDVYLVKFDNDNNTETSIRVDDTGKVVDRREIK